jgi:translocation and assembly module TamB
LSETADTPPPEAAPARRNRLPKAIVVICAILAILIAGAGLTVRYGVLLPQARLLLEARTDGLKLGRYGRLKIEGLGGDIWRDFTVRRLTIRDEKGVWLDARNLHLQWRYEALVRRKFDATRLTAQTVQIVRRPTLTPKGKSKGLPVSIEINQVAARVEMLPAFSYRRGLYDVTGSLDVQRGGGGQSVRLVALSRLHAGDRLTARIETGPARPLNIVIDAMEAQGGAMAGALGLPADQAFALSVRASGKASQGRFTARATSGQTTPLDAKGAWNGQGGDASGRLSLTASRLTQALARRVGPEAVFAIAGRRADAQFFALDARVVAKNLTVHAVGPGDIGKRLIGPQGLALTLQTPALGDLAGGPSKGPATVKGVLKGSQDDLRFTGAAALSRLELGGYGLARVSGPIELSRRKGDLNLKARLAGADGQGTGFVAALLGEAPRADLEGARLADGRLLLKDLEATGAGLKVKASGGRSLLGGLTFKGDAEFSNLAAARPGASGLLTAGWSASQGGAGKPWVLSLDAKGARFASGFAELDRLLGPAPQLSGKAEVAGGRVAVSDARLSGAKVQASAAGVREAAGVMALKLDWSAEGPFRAGPVELTGKVKGAGAVTGTLSEPRADLTADIDQIDLPRLPLKAAHVTLTFARRPDGSSGAIALTAASEYGPAKARSDFRFPQGGVDLTGLSVDAGGVKASGALSLRRRAPSAADLEVAVTQGAFLDGGRLAGTVRITDAAGGAQARLDLTAEDVDPKGVNLAIRRGRLTAAGPMSRLPYALEASGASRGGRWTVDGRGTFVDRDGAYALAFEGDGKLGKRDLHTTEPAVFGFGGGTRTAKLRLAASDGGRIALDGRLGGKDTDVRASLQQIGLGLLNEDLTGQIDANLVLTGQGGRLDGTLDARLEGARGRGTDAATGVDGQVKARLAGDALTIDAETTSRQGLKANASLVLPAEASASPFRVALHRTRPMRGRFFADGEIKPLFDLLVGGERSLAGQVHTEGTLAGSLADPQALGQVTLNGGRFEHGPSGLILRDVTLRAQFVNASINVTEGQGADGHGGTVRGSGRINLTRNGVSSFRMDLADFRLIDNSQATASATGPATIDRDARGRVRITGDLTINEAEVAADPPTPSGVVSMEVIERNKPDDAGTYLQAAPRNGNGVALDVTLKAPRRVFLRGRGLDLELSLDAHVGGGSSKPVLTGVARVVRGDYDFAGKRFEFDDRGFVTLATSPQNIRLNLTAVREDPTLTAAVRIMGTAAKPEITLTSTPVLPSDEILSQVLFGRSAAQLSPLEAAQLASALSAMAGGGGLDVIGNLKNFAGLDRLALGGGGESGVTVAGGKYLTDDVYLELIGGGKDGTAAQVEWRVRRNLAIISKIAGQGDAKLAVRWRRDY